jgi:Baseplate J-like protein
VTIPVPQLDDRRWADLVEEATTFLQGRSEVWTDFSPGDPGVVLLELFAHLTDLMIYRLNRVPEKAFVEYLRLMGLSMRPPAAAEVQLTFACEGPAPSPIPIPRGTRVSVSRVSGGGDPPVFATDDPALIGTGQTSVTVLAHHCDLVEGELIGTGTGQPAQTVTVGRPPVIAPTGNELDLVIGVQAVPEELTGRVPARDYNGTPFRIWQEVDSFVGLSPEDTVYVADRLSGTIVFAPALRQPDDPAGPNAPPTLMAAVPAAGREIRAWYRRGGGSAGNLPAGAISVLKDTVPGVRSVTNAAAATGGRPAEMLSEAMIRGPQELHGIERAVTAEDYEAVALAAGGALARARAFTKAAMWQHADPGTVELLLVPYVDDQELNGTRLSPELLRAHQTETARVQIQQAIDARRPLGTQCQVGWASYKSVQVAARVVVRREENLEAVRGRVEQRLYTTISPLPSSSARSSGWPFGQPLRASNVFDIVLKEPGVRYVDSVAMSVDSAPSQNVLAIARDEFQPHTWYAGAGETVFRSLNDADSWEPVATFGGEAVHRIECHPEQPGHIVVATSVASGSRLHVSIDTGETWDAQPLPKPEFAINDVAWSMSGDAPIVLVASDVGLYQVGLDDASTFVQILVITQQQTRGFYSVAVAVDALGARNVAVAAQAAGGVWLSSEGGSPQTFRDTKTLTGQDIRVLAIQRDGPRAFLWAGAAAAGSDDPGKGTWRWELRGSDDPPEGWVAFGKSWQAGSCWGLAFADATVYASTHHGGVVHLDTTRAASPWVSPPIDSGLPLRDPTKFLFGQLDTVAAATGGLVLTGCATGIFASVDAAHYAPRSQTQFTDSVALPSTWLFVSGEHQITVVSEGDAAA